MAGKLIDCHSMENNFFWPIRVYYEDTDAGGVVYHANYLKFFERARTEYLRQLGFEQDALRSSAGVLFLVKSIHLDYVKSAYFNELLTVSTRLEEIKRASFSFSQTLHRTVPDGEVLCSAHVRVACVSAQGNRPTAIPEPLLERVKDAR